MLGQSTSANRNAGRVGGQSSPRWTAQRIIGILACTFFIVFAYRMIFVSTPVSVKSKSSLLPSPIAIPQPSKPMSPPRTPVVVSVAEPSPSSPPPSSVDELPKPLQSGSKPTTPDGTSEFWKPAPSFAPIAEESFSQSISTVCPFGEPEPECDFTLFNGAKFQRPWAPQRVISDTGVERVSNDSVFLSPVNRLKQTRSSKRVAGQEAIVFSTVPRSGNSWMRSLLDWSTRVATETIFYEDGTSPNPATKARTNKCGVKFDCNKIRPAKKGEPFVVKTHFPFFQNLDFNRPFCSLLRIVRNPVEGFQSWLKYSNGTSITNERSTTMQWFIALFVAHNYHWEVEGKNMITYAFPADPSELREFTRRYSRYVPLYLRRGNSTEHRRECDLHQVVIRYEDITKDPQNYLNWILQYLGLAEYYEITEGNLLEAFAVSPPGKTPSIDWDSPDIQKQLSEAIAFADPMLRAYGYHDWYCEKLSTSDPAYSDFC